MRHCEEAILSERSESKDADEAIPKVLRGDRFASLAMTQRLFVIRPFLNIIDTF